MRSYKPNYDNPKVEEKWCLERRDEVLNYLKYVGVNHGRVGEWPAWHLAPYISIWAVESLQNPGSVGWWVICGDVPTDYISAAELKNPREVMRAIAQRWFEVSDYMRRGEKHPTISIGNPNTWPRLSLLLNKSAHIFMEWAKDDSLWDE